MKTGFQIPICLSDIFISRKVKEMKETAILDLILTKERLVGETEVEGNFIIYLTNTF